MARCLPLRRGGIGKLFLMALFIDIVYQLIAFNWLYPGQSLLMAATLAAPAYAIIRGLTNRLVNFALLTAPSELVLSMVCLLPLS